MRIRLYTTNYIAGIRLCSEKKKLDDFRLPEKEFDPFENGQKIQQKSEIICRGKVTQDVKVEKCNFFG